MKIIVNNEEREIKLASISALSDVVGQIEATLQQGFIITEIKLNDKKLENNWFQTASKTYLLDDDILELQIQESATLATQVLKKSKDDFSFLIESFKEIADAFRIQNETEANGKFFQGIDNLQWFLRLIEDAAILLGRPLSTIMHNEIEFTSYVNELVGKLDQVITTQSNKDWVMLADLIEYEMIPTLSKFEILYEIFKID